MPSFLKSKKSFVILAALIVIQLVLISIQIPGREDVSLFEKSVFTVFSPLQHGFSAIVQGLGRLWANYFTLRDVTQDNLTLQQENVFLREENNLLRNAILQFRTEDEIESLLEKIHDNILPVRTIGYDQGNFARSLTINRGKIDGLEKNMMVLDRYGNLVGRIIEPLSSRQARVQLVTDIESGVSVTSQENKVVGVLSGDGRGGCDLEYILSTETGIQAGEKVITSGMDGLYPPGILVGEIIDIQETSGLFKNVTVKTEYTLKDLRNLVVVRILAAEFY